MHLANNSLPVESLNSTLQKFIPSTSNTLYRTSVSNREISVSHNHFYDSFLINGKYKNPSQIDLLAVPPNHDQILALERLTQELTDSLELCHRRTLEKGTFHWILNPKAEFLLLNCSDFTFSSDENKVPRPPSAPSRPQSKRSAENRPFPCGVRSPTTSASTRVTTPKSYAVTHSTQTAFACCTCSVHLQRCLSELSQGESERSVLEEYIRTLEASQSIELSKVTEFREQKCSELHRSLSNKQ